MSGLLERLLGRLKGGLRGPGPDASPHPFDVAHGVDTSGLYYADKLPTGHAHDRYSEGYYATAPSVLHEALAQWQAVLPPGLTVRDYSLIDLGAGKGRVVLLASLYPFRSVRGIELNPALARIARRNLRSWMRAHSNDGHARCQDVTVEGGDVLDVAADLVSESQPVLLFLFNSFGAEVVAPLMEKLAAPAGARTAPIDLIYIHPDHDRIVARTPRVELLRYVEIPFSYEDAVADAFEVSSDLCSIYRIA